MRAGSHILAKSLAARSWAIFEKPAAKLLLLINGNTIANDLSLPALVTASAGLRFLPDLSDLSWPPSAESATIKNTHSQKWGSRFPDTV